jgi:hypothetical protein
VPDREEYSAEFLSVLDRHPAHDAGSGGFSETLMGVEWIPAQGRYDGEELLGGGPVANCEVRKDQMRAITSGWGVAVVEAVLERGWIRFRSKAHTL